MHKLHSSSAVDEAGVPTYGDGEPALFQCQAAAQALTIATYCPDAGKEWQPGRWTSPIGAADWLRASSRAADPHPTPPGTLSEGGARSTRTSPTADRTYRNRRHEGAPHAAQQAGKAADLDGMAS